MEKRLHTSKSPTKKDELRVIKSREDEFQWSIQGLNGACQDSHSPVCNHSPLTCVHCLAHSPFLVPRYAPVPSHFLTATPQESSFIQFNKYLERTYLVPGNILHRGEKVMHETGLNPWLTSTETLFCKSSNKYPQGLCLIGLAWVTRPPLESVMRSAPPWLGGFVPSWRKVPQRKINARRRMDAVKKPE